MVARMVRQKISIGILAIVLISVASTPAFASDEWSSVSAQRIGNEARLESVESSASEVNNSVVLESPNGQERSIVPDANNVTGYEGVSATLIKANTDRVELSQNNRIFTLMDVNGQILVTSVDPQVEINGGLVDAKFIVEGDKLIVTPVQPVLEARSGCNGQAASIIFNWGMAGVCAALTVGTVVGGVVCTAALVAGGGAINWNANCG